MIRMEWLIGKQINVYLNDVFLYSYTLAGIKTTHPTSQLYVFYDNEDEIRGIFTRQEVGYLTECGKSFAHLRQVHGDFLVKVVDFKELQIKDRKEVGEKARKEFWETIIPQVRNGVRGKEPNRLFAYRVVRMLGDQVKDNELTDIANKVGYKVKTFVENYHDFRDIINGKKDTRCSEWWRMKAQDWWWIRLRELENELWRDRVL